MREEQVAGEDGELIVELREMLHNLCQPLTALQCRLEIGLMDGDVASMRKAIGEALRECERLNGKAHAMQVVLRRSGPKKSQG